MYQSDDEEIPTYFTAGNDEKKADDKPKADPFKFDKLAVGYVEYRAGRGEYPLFHNGRMYHYTGTHYAHEPEPDHAVREWMKATKKGQSNNVVGNVRPVIESYCRKPITKFPAMPFYCGSETFPDSKNVIAYTNGLLDVAVYLDGGDVQLIPHTPKWVSTTCLPFAFDVDAACPSWLQFLNDVFDGDAARIDLLQEWCGYCLTTDTSLHTALIQVGKSRSGKGTTQRLLQALIGGGNWTAYTLPQLASEFGMSPLDGKQVAFVGEVELSNNPHRAAIMERLKNIIGEDPVSINEKYEKPRSVRLPTRFMISCNELPTLHDASGAVGQRFLYLHYQRSFAGREDRGLEGRLMGELAGINNWALAGLSRLRKNGGQWTTPETTKKLADDFLMRSNPIHAYVRDRLVVHRLCDPGDIPDVELTDKPVVTATRDAVYQSYKLWCEDHDTQEKDFRWFGRDLANALPKVTDSRPKANGGRVRVYVGIGLKTVREAPETGPADPTHEAPTSAAGPIPEVHEGQRVRLPWMPGDIDGEVIATFRAAGTARVKFFLPKNRYAGLNDTQKGRLRPASTNTYIVDVPLAAV